MTTMTVALANPEMAQYIADSITAVNNTVTRPVVDGATVTLTAAALDELADLDEYSDGQYSDGQIWIDGAGYTVLPA